jgi:hypothetical protein
MNHEYIDDLAADLRIDSFGLHKVIQRLGIRTMQTAVPPYGVEVSEAVSHDDAERLRRYLGDRPASGWSHTG